jgi:hypothetical protein
MVCAFSNATDGSMILIAILIVHVTDQKVKNGEEKAQKKEPG